MRVHPSVISASKAKWHFPVAVALLVMVLASNLLRGPEEPAEAAKPPSMPMTAVVIAKSAIGVGQPILPEALIIEQRPVSTVTADVITSLEEVRNKVAAGPIPAGFPLAKAFLSDPGPVSDEQQADVAPPPPAPDPIEARLAAIQASTVALNIVFPGVAPKRGSRVALSLQGPRGKSALIAEEAWIESNESNSAVVRFQPHVALFVGEAKQLGQLSYFKIPVEGKSPYVNQAVNDMKQLRERLGLVEKKKKSLRNVKAARDRLGNKLSPGSFRSYAWINGEEIVYSLDEKGKVFVIDSNGVVAPLSERRFNFNDNSGGPTLFGMLSSEDEAKSPAPRRSPVSESPQEERETESASETNRRPAPRTGLEPLYPMMGIDMD